MCLTLGFNIVLHVFRGPVEIQVHFHVLEVGGGGEALGIQGAPNQGVL